MNVNLKIPAMNPVNPAQDMNMIWMAAPTSIEGFYPSSVPQLPGLDELSQQSNTTLMDPITNDFNGQVAGMPINPVDLFNLQQLQLQQQLEMQNYAQAMGLGANLVKDPNNVSGVQEMMADEDDDDEEQQGQYTGNYQFIETSDQENAILNDDFNSNSSSGNFMMNQQQHMFDVLKSSTSTQTCNTKGNFKKIKPVKRPGLVLKTPIAYQGNIDPSVIPIQRDGMAVCEKCGAIGVKHSFYTRQRRFCSMACARGFELTSSAQPSTSNNNIKLSLEEKQSTNNKNMYQVQSSFRFKFSNGNSSSDEQAATYQMEDNLTTASSSSSVLYRDVLPQEQLPQIPKLNRLPSPCPQDDKIQTIRRRPNEFVNSYDWTMQLNDPDFYAAPVTCFRHAPGYEMWPNIVANMKVEVENTDSDQTILIGNTPHSFWVASVLKVHGYKAQLRYEGFEDDASHDFWVNLCSSEVHPVGWCATRGKPLIPPRSIENKFSDWKEFLVQHLSGARTLPSTFYNKISDSFRSRFRCGLWLEVVDKNRISQMKVATVCKIVGKRLFVRYYDSPPEDGFWCHEDSPLIHHVGWAASVGHNLAAPDDYMERVNDEIFQPVENDSTVDLFKMNFSFEDYYLAERMTAFVKGMKLEAVDPLNLSSICVATVMDVLNFGYIMIRIDSYDPDATGADWFCYHEKSPSIFPAGFCAKNGINLTPPKGYDSESFTWDQYLIDTNSMAASEDLFPMERPRHRFKVGMKLECADLMDPRLVCVATISRVVGRLLKIHFDGWEDEYDQWLDCNSPDVYPVGWCVLVGHKLEGPRILPKMPIQPKISPKLGRKKRGRRKGGKNADGSSKDQKAAPFTRTAQIKKELEEFEQQKQQSKQPKRPINQVPVKLEPKTEMFENNQSHEEEDEDDYESSLNQSFEASNASKTEELAEDFTEEEQDQTVQEDIVPKYIPKLNQPGSSNSPDANAARNLNPDDWTVDDVIQFLTVNDCAAHCEAFASANVTGKRLFELTKDDIITLLGMKVGPALKIFDIIQQLKCRVNPKLLKGTLTKKFL